jgi:hypothetical protein
LLPPPLLPPEEPELPLPLLEEEAELEEELEEEGLASFLAAAL